MSSGTVIWPPESCLRLKSPIAADGNTILGFSFAFCERVGSQRETLAKDEKEASWQAALNCRFRVRAVALWPSAIDVPAAQRGLWVDWVAVDVNLEVEVAADRDRVAGLPHRADSLAGPDPLALVDRGPARHVCVEVAAVLAFAVDQEVVAVEDRVVAGAQDAAAADGDQRRVAGGDDVEALVGAAAVARGAEFADRAAGPVRSLDRKDVVVVGGGTVARREAGRSGSDESREEEEG
jgi:hypothetical protein